MLKCMLHIHTHINILRTHEIGFRPIHDSVRNIIIYIELQLII